MKKLILIIGLLLLPLVVFASDRAKKFPTDMPITVLTPSDIGTNIEAYLGNPTVNGYVLSSTIAGVRSWVAQGGGSMVYPGAGIALSTGTAWTTSITDNSANWNTAYSWGDHSTVGYWTTSAGKTWQGNDIALTTNTSGNYVASVATTAPLSGGAAGSEGATLTLSIPKADTSTNGYLWTSDWNTFNNKQAALGYTPAYQWTIAGGTGSDLIGNTAEIWTITGETASGHSTSESGNTLTISQTKASTTANGYLWSTDWNTFNGKQAGHANLTSLAGLTYASTSFVKMTGANTFSLDTATYQPTDADVTSIANGITGIVKGAGNGNGYSAATAGTDYGMQWTLAADSGTAVLIGDTAETFTIAGGTNGIDTAISGNTTTINFDPTEVLGVTWMAGAAASYAWTFDLSGTDDVVTFGSDLFTLSNSLTLATGKNFKVGTTQWNNGDSIDGTKLAAMTSAQLYGVLSDEVGTGKLAFNHKTTVSIVNPNAVVTASTIIPVWNITDAAITVDRIDVSTSSASYEAAGDLKYADARIGLGNATVINDFDTSSGVRTDTTITSASVAAGKFVYLSFDSAPSASMTDFVITITWHYS